MGKTSMFVVQYVSILSVGCVGAILVFLMEPWVIGAMVMIFGLFLMAFFLDRAIYNYDSIFKKEKTDSTTNKEDDLE